MSPTKVLSLRRVLRGRGFSTSLLDEEGGFSLIEVLIAFLVLTVVLLGTVPLFYAGIRSTLIAEMDTSGKNLAQQRIEQMRNLPFHVDVNDPPAKPSVCWTDTARTNPEAGAVDCDYRDMLDTYYRSLTAATSTSTPGFVSEVAARTSDEPAGAFYRFVVSSFPGFSGLRQTIATQFLDVNRNPLTPSSYNSQVTGQDFPRSRLVGVTMVTTWGVYNLDKKFVTFTQIAEGKPAPPVVTLQARSTAFRVTGGMPRPAPDAPAPLLALEAGISSSDGGITSGATASTQLQGSFASIAPGVRADGRSAGATAPPNSTVFDDERTPYSLIDGLLESSPSCLTSDCVAFSHTSQVKNVVAATTGGQVIVASPPSPATGRVRSNSTNGALNLGFRNRPEDTSMPGFDIARMLVRIDETDTGAHAAVGSTHLVSTGGVGHSAEARASASTQTIKLVPTTFAPDGVVQLTLTSATLTCQTTGAAGTATADFSATVRYLRYNSITNQNDYVTNAVNDEQVVSPLTAALLSSVQITTNPGGLANLVPLSSYVDSWGSLTAATSTISSPPRSVKSNLNGIVNVTTKPVRLTDPDSGVAVQVGNLSCVAEDQR